MIRETRWPSSGRFDRESPAGNQQLEACLLTHVIVVVIVIVIVPQTRPSRDDARWGTELRRVCNSPIRPHHYRPHHSMQCTGDHECLGQLDVRRKMPEHLLS